MAHLKRRGNSPKAPPPPPTEWGRLERAEFLRRQLDDSQADVDGARAAESWQAVAGLRRQVLFVREEIDKLEAEGKLQVGGRDLSRVSEEEFIAMAIAAAEAMPDAYLELYVRVYMDRHGIRVLGAAGGGR